jgi:hypothetical protein
MCESFHQLVESRHQLLVEVSSGTIQDVFTIGLTDHLERPLDRPSAASFDAVADLVRLADALGMCYTWFTEHHAHHGHIPTPLLFALHLAGQTRHIRLTGGWLAVGFGCCSTPAESVCLVSRKAARSSAAIACDG